MAVCREPPWAALELVPQGNLAERMRAAGPGVGAHLGDRAGNLLYRKTPRNFGPVMVAAAKLTVAQVVRVVDAGVIDPECVVTPGIYVDIPPGSYVNLGITEHGMPCMGARRPANRRVGLDARLTRCAPC